MVELRASTLELDRDHFNLIESAKIHNEPCIEGTSFVVSTRYACGTALPFCTIVTVQRAFCTVLALRLSNKRHRNLGIYLRSITQEHLELIERLTINGSTFCSVILHIAACYGTLLVDGLPTGSSQFLFIMEDCPRLAIGRIADSELCAISPFPEDFNRVERTRLTHVECPSLVVSRCRLPTSAFIAVDSSLGITATGCSTGAIGLERIILRRRKHHCTCAK